MDYQLIQTPNGLGVYSPSQPQEKPLVIDFLSGTLGYRHTRGQHEAIAKAVAIQKHPGAVVLDTTAGLGRDALILAALGAKVTMLERSPIMAALLHDALQRAAIAPALSAIVPQQLQLIQIDACTFLQQLNPQAYPDVILCDPMHPNRSKTALVKKDMRILQTIVGQDIDASELLQLALIKAKKRVVVKRPRHAPPLWPNPTMVHSYTSSRFDIYLTKNRPI